MLTSALLIASLHAASPSVVPVAPSLSAITLLEELEPGAGWDSDELEPGEGWNSEELEPGAGWDFSAPLPPTFTPRRPVAPPAAPSDPMPSDPSESQH